MAGVFYSLASMFALILFFSIYPAISSTEATKRGFSVDLIHRDSPNSPLYNPNETPLERYNNGLRRAFSRLNRLNMTSSINPNAAQIDVSADNGQYLMKYSIGTPPVDIYGIVDTGSDLMWTQCQPCEQCFQQKNPIFDPAKSSSYSKLSCQSAQCHLLESVSCSPQQLCYYTYGYASTALTKGILSTETVTIGSASIKNLVFGCGHNNTGWEFNPNEMGIVGLGGTDLSFASQVFSQLGAKKFSHCLVPFHTNPSLTSKMIFGNDAAVSGPGVVSTPLVAKDDKTVYFVTLEGISVGDKFVPYTSSGTVAKGNVFIDSGVPPTLLPRDFYNRLEQEVKNAIKLTPYQDPELGSQLCYQSQTMIAAPTLTAQFDGGAKVPLIPTSTFIPPKDGVFCFAMLPQDNGGPYIIGNYAQSSLLIGYDLDRRVVSFKPTDCTKQ